MSIIKIEHGVLKIHIKQNIKIVFYWWHGPFVGIRFNNEKTDFFTEYAITEYAIGANFAKLKLFSEFHQFFNGCNCSYQFLFFYYVKTMAKGCLKCMGKIKHKN